MNQKKAKEIRSILNLQPGDPITKRNYRGVKKEYNNLSAGDREKFLNNLRKLFV
jgi:hypothetical protein